MTQSPRLARSTRLLLVSALMLLAAGFVTARQAAAPAAPRQSAQKKWPLTRPEATNYAETSSYEEVISYMKAMAAASPQIHLTTYGYTYEGRPLPLAVIGAPAATAGGGARHEEDADLHPGEHPRRRGRGKGGAALAAPLDRQGRARRVVQVGRPPHQPDLQRRRQRARQRGEPREPERPGRRHGPAHQRPEPRPEPRLHEDGDRRGPLAGHAAHRLRPAHGDRPPHDRRERRQRLLPHLRNVAQPERLEGDGRPAAQRPAARR